MLINANIFTKSKYETIHDQGEVVFCSIRNENELSKRRNIYSANMFCLITLGTDL